MLHSIEKVVEKLSWCMMVGNWHKITLISKVMCKMGRHDYEVKRVRGGVVMLECFYCLRKKRSLGAFGDRDG